MAGQHNSNDTQLAREAWFTRIVQEHARLLYRVAFSVLRNPEDAEDAVADTMLKLLRTDSWQAVTNERAFLARSVWRTALDRFAARRPAGELDLQLEDTRPSPEESAFNLHERKVLHALIDRLPAELREPLLLSAVDDLNSREIGDLMQLPEGTVRTRLMRARTSLRQVYEELQENRRGREVAARGSER
jgi:RNA polymerase sigma-70 factor (ECF subfamily)